MGCIRLSTLDAGEMAASQFICFKFFAGILIEPANLPHLALSTPFEPCEKLLVEPKSNSQPNL
jgi:hypothetical protein